MVRDRIWKHPSSFLASCALPLFFLPSIVGDTLGNFVALKRLQLSNSPDQKSGMSAFRSKSSRLPSTFIARKYLFGAFVSSSSGFQIGSPVSRFRGGCSSADGRCKYCTKAHQTSVFCKAAKTAYERRGRQGDGWALLSTMRERKLGDVKVGAHVCALLQTFIAKYARPFDHSSIPCSTQTHSHQRAFPDSACI
jgi:hypothetical protein